MKKISVLAAALAIGAVSFVSAEGFKFSGYVRSGASVNTKGETFDNSTWQAGDFFGGPSRVRMNLDWSNDMGGATLRYQKSGSFADSDWFDSDNIKYAMAYANFLDGKVIVEGGKLLDRYTTTGGWEDGTFGDNLGAGLGARLVLNPFEGLYLAASATETYAEKYVATDSKVKDGDATEGELKFDENLFGFSAKYSTDAFFVSAGAHLAKVYYGSLGFTGVENLTVAFEAFADYRDNYTYAPDSNKKPTYASKTEVDGKYTDNILLVPYVEYTGIENLDIGFFAYIYSADDAYFEAIAEKDTDNFPTFAELVPAVSYQLNDIVKLACEANIFIPKDLDKYDFDSYTVVVPSVTFLAGEKASVNVWASISSDTDYSANSFGAGVKYNF